MRSAIGSAAAALLASTLAVSLPGVAITAAAAETNWMREHVLQWQRKMLARFLDRDAASRMSVAPRIIGGNVAAPGVWPFQAALLFAADPNNASAQYCGGSIIHEEFILTAAHCADFVTREEVSVLTNTQSLASGGIRHAVAKIVVHPQWNPGTSDFDVAVLKLKRKVKGIRPTKFAQIITTADEEAEVAAPNTNAKVIGWGDINPGGGQTYPTELYEVQVPIVKRSKCNAPTSYDGAITPRMICAGFAEGGKDSCQGDSGGPLLVKNAVNKFRTQVGIVSWGDGCALPNFYGVYSRLAVLGAWVENTTAALTD